jgi:hypothetical protein
MARGDQAVDRGLQKARSRRGAPLALRAALRNFTLIGTLGCQGKPASLPQKKVTGRFLNGNLHDCDRLVRALKGLR